MSNQKIPERVKIKVKYPECKKLAKVSDDSQKIGAFLDWLCGEQGLTICEYTEIDEDVDGFAPIGYTFENLLAKYFKVNMDKVEKERRQILVDLRKKQ